MIKPKANKIIYAFFAWYIKRIINKDFSGFHFQAIDYPKEKAILLLANHFSWWDGFILFQLNRLYFKKKFHVMVLEETSKKVKFLKYLGAFSIQKNAKSLLESLDYAGSLLNQPDNLLLIFPQGQLQSQHSKSISFQKGLFKIINASQKNFSYIFAVTLVDYFQHRKPKIHIFLQHWQAPPFASLQMIKTAYNKHYEEVLQQQSEIKV